MFGSRPLLSAVLIAAVAVAVAPGHHPPPAVAAAADDGTVSVLLLSIDALDPDQLDAVDADSGGDPIAPNLRRLRDEGTVFTEARAVMGAETLPNHVSMGTGTYAGTHGIPGNDGRLAVGDTSAADPDLGVRGARQATSLVWAIEDQCPDLRTVTAFSKNYVWRTFQDQTAGPFGSDPAVGDHVPESDHDFYQPDANIPGSGHAPDLEVLRFVARELDAGAVDHAFVNFGDHDRAGHVDGTGGDPFNLDVRGAQRGALAQIDSYVGALRAQLEQQGRWQQTVVLLVSDHSMLFRAADATLGVDIDAALEEAEVANGLEPGSALFSSLNGGVAFVYLVDPALPEADRLLVDARARIAALDGVDEVLHREPNPLDADDTDLASVHPDWRLGGTERAGSLVATAEATHALGTLEQNPLPGNHGHAATRHVTAIVTGGWDGVVQQVVEPSQPELVDVVDDTALLPEQAEQVDWAPTIGWLLGVEDPGLAAGGAPQWEGRVLSEAFSRRPAVLPCAAPAADAAGSADAADDATTDGAADPGDSRDPDEDAAGSLAATGAGTGLAGLALLGLAAAGRRRRRGDA